MINKLLAVILVLLLIFTIFCTVQSCAQIEKSVVYPETIGNIWLEDGIVVWSRTPVRVAVENNVLYNELMEDVVVAVDVWNTAIGCEVLAPSTYTSAEIFVSIEPRPLETPNWAASFRYHWPSGSSVRGFIHVYEVRLADLSFRKNVMTHEIGHALGLRDLLSKKDHVMHEAVHSGEKIDPEATSYLNWLYCQERN